MHQIQTSVAYKSLWFKIYSVGLIKLITIPEKGMIVVMTDW